MKWVRRWLTRMLARRADGGIEREIKDELSFHIERRTEDNIEAGMSRPQARRDALRRFGDVDDVTVRGKAIRRYHPIRTFGSDTRQAARGLLRNPGFAAVTIVTLALGIGATTAIFALVSGVVLGPLPYPESDRLVYLGHEAPGINFEGDLGLAPGLYRMYVERRETLEELGFWNPAEVTLTGEGDPERFTAAIATSTLLQLLRARPVHGRPFVAEDDEPGSARVVLLSEGLWRRRYGGDPSVVGSTIQINGIARDVVGILPRDFDFPDAETELWLDTERRLGEGLGGFGELFGLGRMKPAMTTEDVRRDIDARIAEFVDNIDVASVRQLIADARIGSRPILLKERMVGDIERTLWILFGTVGFVLLIACANVANLFLVRAEGRRRETAVRMALGAGRWQLARHFLAESALLSLSGGVVGLALAGAAVRFLVRTAPLSIPRLHEVGIDPAVLTFTAAITLTTSLVFGSVPALRGSSRLADSLKQGGRGTTAGRKHFRSRQVLVVSQVGLALVLLVGSGLMARSFWHLKNVDPGFAPENVLRFSLALPNSQYEEAEAAAAFHHQLLDRLAALPGVISVTAGLGLPLDGHVGSNLLYEEGKPVEEGTLPPLVRRNRITENYFETLGIPLIAGRTLQRSDTEQRTNATVINTEAAELFWGPDENPIGKRIQTENGQVGEEPNWFTIVGVVASYRQDDLIQDLQPMFFLPILGGDFDQARQMTYALRTAVPPLDLAAAVRNTVWGMDPNLPLISLGTLLRSLEEEGAPMAFTMVLLAIAAGVALVLGSVGVYGVLAYVVRQRTGEIGVRMALGARAADVRGMLLLQGAAIAGVGLGIGLAASFALVRFMEALLFGVDPLDLATHVAVVILLFSVVLLATYLPARRASRIDPVEALRSE